MLLTTTTTELCSLSIALFSFNSLRGSLYGQSQHFVVIAGDVRRQS
jgi:hypothetical protein